MMMRFINGKHAGKRVKDILDIDPGYIWDVRPDGCGSAGSLGFIRQLQQRVAEVCREEDEYDCLRIQNDTERALRKGTL